jgi:hypothetical protein
MKIEFDYKGFSYTLTKHPRVLSELKASKLTEADARLRPWYFRPIWRRDRPFKLSVGDADAIRGAKDIIKGRTEKPEQFSAWLADQDKRRGITLGDLAAEWIAAGLPFSKTLPRQAAAAAKLSATLARALPWWKDRAPASITPDDHENYVVHRRTNNRLTPAGSTAGTAGSRSADLELSALSCLCQWAIKVGHLEANPFAKRARYHVAAAVQHCHQFAPATDEELHQILAWFFAGDLRQQIAGAWLAFTALTGLRPEEPAYLYRCGQMYNPPPKPAALPPGMIFPDRTGQMKMKILRTKHGQNPYVNLHPVLLDFLTTYEAWLRHHLPKPATEEEWPAWFPNPTNILVPICPVGETTYLNKRLELCCEALKLEPRKPKGVGRAFYVAVRRSAGLDDATIASELGQTTNGALIRSTYGDPDAMLGGALLDWLPESTKEKSSAAAWAALQVAAVPQSNIIQL